MYPFLQRATSKGGRTNSIQFMLIPGMDLIYIQSCLCPSTKKDTLLTSITKSVCSEYGSFYVVYYMSFVCNFDSLWASPGAFRTNPAFCTAPLQQL